jgi:drug/metabolite transporter (DMT)-like permease
MVLAATVLWSTAGLFVRLVNLDAWAILGWRSVFAALALAVIVEIQRRAKDKAAASAPATSLLLMIPVAVMSMGAYVVSLKLTSVANVMIVYATVPLVAAGLAWLALREALPRTVLLASLLALLGVFVMVGGAVHPSDLIGIGVALLMTLAMAAQIVAARKHSGMNMALVNMVAACICAVVGLALTSAGLPSPAELVTLMLFGVTNTALAYYFVLRGARLIPSAEVGLISTLDVVLGPLWVWLLFAENPGFPALVGGALVLAAVMGYLFAQRRSTREQREFE